MSKRDVKREEWIIKQQRILGCLPTTRIVLIQAKSGVRKGSEEGTEMVVKATRPREESQVTIFFPKLLLSSVNDIVGIYELRADARAHDAFSERPGCVFIAGKGDDGKAYLAEIHSTELLFKRLHRARELELARETDGIIMPAVLNNLIQKLAETGFSVTYYCSSCGAPIKISGETVAEAIKFCSYCGARIKTMDLIQFLKFHLSKLLTGIK